MIHLVLMCSCNIFKSPCKWLLLLSFACLCGTWGGCKYQIFLKHSEVVWVLFFVVSFVLVLLVCLVFFRRKSKFHLTCTLIALSKFFFKCDQIAGFHITHSPPFFGLFPYYSTCYISEMQRKPQWNKMTSFELALKSRIHFHSAEIKEAKCFK